MHVSKSNEIRMMRGVESVFSCCMYYLDAMNRFLLMNEKSLWKLNNVRKCSHGVQFFLY